MDERTIITRMCDLEGELAFSDACEKVAQEFNLTSIDVAAIWWKTVGYGEEED